MKKTKLLMPLVGVASLGAVAAPMVALTSCSKTQVLTYEQAFDWVKANYGKESKDYTINKTESAWAFCGWINNYGKTEDVKNMTTYLYNHLDNLIISITNQDQDKVKSSELDRKGATGQTTGGTCSLGDIAFTSDLLQEQKLISDTEVAEKTLSEDNFIDMMEFYFSGAFKHNAEYIVNGKSLTIHGTLSYVMESETAPGNWDNLKMPGCYITFDGQGRMTEFKLDFKEMTSCSYTYNNGTRSDGYTFQILSGGFVDGKYSFKAE